MKKAHLSPVAPLLVSFSLAFGILVSDVCGYRFLTAAHANPGKGNDKGVVARQVRISDGLVLGGGAVHDVIVNGRVVKHGSIAGDVQVSDAHIVGKSGVIVGDGGRTSADGVPGVIVGDGAPVTAAAPADVIGVIVGDGAPVATAASADGVIGVIVGDGAPVAAAASADGVIGVIVGDGSPVASAMTVGGSVIVGDDVRITGGSLTGDNIQITNGVITGQNLRLTGATISGKRVNFTGSGVTVQISPAN